MMFPKRMNALRGVNTTRGANSVCSRRPHRCSCNCKVKRQMIRMFSQHYGKPQTVPGHHMATLDAPHPDDIVRNPYTYHRIQNADKNVQDMATALSSNIQQSAGGNSVTVSKKTTLRKRSSSNGVSFEKKRRLYKVGGYVRTRPDQSSQEQDQTYVQLESSNQSTDTNNNNSPCDSLINLKLNTVGAPFIIPETVETNRIINIFSKTATLRAKGKGAAPNSDGVYKDIYKLMCQVWATNKKLKSQLDDRSRSRSNRTSTSTRSRRRTLREPSFGARDSSIDQRISRLDVKTRRVYELYKTLRRENAQMKSRMS